MSNPHNPGEVKVTIKYGKGYEESWAVFAGESAGAIRSQLCDYFGFTVESVADLTLHDVVVNCTKLAHGTARIASTLGGTVIPASDAGKPSDESSSAGDPWAAAEAKAAEPVKEPTLTERAQATTSVKDLQLLWSDNKEAFEADADLMAAYKAHGKMLQQKAQAESVMS